MGRILLQYPAIPPCNVFFLFLFFIENNLRDFLRRPRPADAAVNHLRLDRHPQIKPKVQDRAREGHHDHVQAHEQALQIFRVVLLRSRGGESRASAI